MTDTDIVQRNIRAVMDTLHDSLVKLHEAGYQHEIEARKERERITLTVVVMVIPEDEREAD